MGTGKGPLSRMSNSVFGSHPGTNRFTCLATGVFWSKSDRATPYTEIPVLLALMVAATSVER